MDDFSKIAYDAYLIRLYRCHSLEQFDSVMARASSDSDVSHSDFVRLTFFAKMFMEDREVIK